ncbi:DUF6402 family protein [Pseudomonas sp. KU26590]|uniref:DUF6402 family protein n=1 Tax=Pseudomonas sp. KU26590 TaxID=2991051 RepID=UPI00223E7302|nr:DUF6402 family protein [Pseudomonas sp. KU26590]UZJ60832.1 DUF6402 family protein [Pseudomonas sp. KU26590]
MSTIKKPYYTMERALFRGKVWKEYSGSLGAVPINTTQKISYSQLPPGTLPESETDQDKVERQETKEPEVERPMQVKPVQPAQLKTHDAEDKDKLPEFDIQDIPDAMDRIGWPVAAKLARVWFSTPKNIWDNNLNSTQPVNSSIVTIDWALSYGNLRDKFNKLIDEDIYSDKAVSLIRKKIFQHVTTQFIETQSTSPILNLETSTGIAELSKFHSQWQVQQRRISTFDTLDGLLMTDLSAALGNFVLYAAIGRAEVKSERYFDYQTHPYQYCAEATARVTHVYIYVKDNYSFNDKDPTNSQYLGHWNKKNMILSYTVAANDLLGQYAPEWKVKSLNSSDEIERTELNWDYLINRSEVDKPIDKRTGIVRKFIEKDIYWPVYNKSYNEWREQHARGGDFMIFSEPKLYKLKKPISFKLDRICRPYDNTSTHR